MVSWTGNVPHIKLHGTHFQSPNVHFSTAEHKRHFDFETTGLNHMLHLWHIVSFTNTYTYTSLETETNTSTPTCRHFWTFSICSVHILASRETHCIILWLN